MQRLAPDFVGEHVGTAVVEQHEVELLRPVIGVHTGPQRRVRIHALAGGRARQQLQAHLEVAPFRQHLLDPHHRDQHPRQREAHPPVALGLRRRVVPVSATPKFAPEIATGTDRNFSRRWRRAASAIAVMSQPRS